ncbi:TPA: hypothetical protein ACRNYL_000490 [Pseudomonas aeruginosa]
MSIDWNTAPDGATHWEPDSYHVFGSWMKKEGYSWFWWEGDVGRWSPSLFISEQRMGTFEARPQESWNGQGLPPIGTVCEYRHMIWPEYRPCEIRYISEESLVAYDDAQEQFYRTCDMLFRPIRTPEQIAAEEREKAIEEMCFAEETLTVKQAKALYESGYRRQESST